MKVTLKNTSKRTKVLDLPYQVCGELSFCHKQKRGHTVQMSDGSKAVRRHTARLSKSLTLLPGEEVKGLPAGVLKAPQIKQRGLKVSKVLEEGDRGYKAPATEPTKAPSPLPKPEPPAPQPEPEPRKGGRAKSQGK